MKKSSLILFLCIMLPMVLAMTMGSCSQEVISPASSVDTIYNTITVHDTIVSTKHDTVYIVQTDNPGTGGNSGEGGSGEGGNGGSGEGGNGGNGEGDSGGGVVKPDISVGNTPRPTNWQIASGVKFYPAAMYVILDNNGVPVTLEKGDLLAAFIDGTCHGVAEAETGSDGYTRFSLKVNLFQGEETRNDLKVELHYYSIKYKRVFKAPSIPFEEDAILGKLYAGYRPTLWAY